MKEQWEYAVEFKQGQLSVTGVERRVWATPQRTARKLGRYALELWIGRELIDRVRFDFPLGGADAPSTPGRVPLHEPPNFSGGVTATVKVLVPASLRATRAVLIDRATGQVHELPWPPDAPLDGHPQPPDPSADRP